METGPQLPLTASRARATARARRSRGQSLAEFALTVPMLLLMILFGLDFGRVFLGWVALNSAAREAANYAAMNPTAWTSPYDTDIQAEFLRLVETEASDINCTLESVSDPTFPDGTGIGAPALVELECAFELITPFIAIFTGNPIPVSASSAFPVRAGLIESVPLETPTPTPEPTPTPSVTPSPSPSPTPTPTATVIETAAPSAEPTASPTPTPSPTPKTCTVVSLINVNTSKAASTWKKAGFSGTVIFSPLVPPNYRIAWQSVTPIGSTVVCTSSVTVRSSPP